MEPLLYSVPDSTLWKGREDGPETLRFHQAVSCLPLEEIKKNGLPTIGFLGFASDAGIQRNQGRIGASQGPVAIRKALANLPYHANKSISLFDFGNIQCRGDSLEEAQQALSNSVYKLLSNDTLPILFGGGHEIAWGHYEGLMKKYPSERFTLINIDAHYDLRPLIEGKGNSGTSFEQIADSRLSIGLEFDYCCIGVQELANTESLFKRALELNVKTIYAYECFYNHNKVLKNLEDTIESAEHIYLTVCLDVFAMPFAPGVSAPQPLGLLPWHVIPMIQLLAESGKVRGFDVAELSPQHDKDEVTAKLAAMLVATFVQAWS